MAVASVAAATGDAAARCRFINERLPERSIYSDAKRAVQAGSRASWRLSPEPFWLTPELVAYLAEIGNDLLAFYRATNALYFAAVRGTQPAWVADYFDRGRPSQLIDYGRLNRTRRHLPGVIRPDLFLTDGGLVATELDSVPGGIGFGASLAAPYAALKERFHLEQHHAKRFWGFLTRTATKIAAHTFALLWPLGSTSQKEA